MGLGSLMLMAVTGVVALALAAPDWTDCPSPCLCKWSSGKKTALCRNVALTTLPGALDPDIQVLDLSGNGIRTLGREAFQVAGLINLQRIYLRSTRLKDINKDAFRQLIILIEVDLSDNDIEYLHPDTFFGNERLRVLYLSRNPLRRLGPAQFPSLPHLRTLELEECQLEAIHSDAFLHLVALESLNLKANKLRNLSEATFMTFARLKSLQLDGNLWRCDCDLRSFRDWFLASNLHSTSLTCTEPDHLQGLRWEDVGADRFACAPKVVVAPFPQVQAEAGGNVTFGCRVTGDPEPTVTWFYEERPVNDTTLMLISEEGLLDKWVNLSVPNVSSGDAGLYTCVAKNILGEVSGNVSLILPEVLTATTLSKSESRMLWWVLVGGSGGTVVLVVCVITTICGLRGNGGGRRGRRRNMKASVSFTDQEKKLLDVSIATTTDRGAGSCEALHPGVEMVEPPVHITIESEPLPIAVFPPPPEFSTSVLPAGAYGNILISVSVSRDPSAYEITRCPDLLDLPQRVKPVYHGMATLPRRPQSRPAPHYDNMGPRVTAGGSSTLSLPGSAGELPPPPPPPPPPPACIPLSPEFVSL